MAKDVETREIEHEEESSVLESKFGSEVSAEAQNKIVRLFGYLEKALSLDDSVVRDFKTSIVAPSPWWLADYPGDLDSLYIRPFDTDKESYDLDAHTAWLKIEKQTVEAAPALPELLMEWVPEVTPLTEPSPLEKVDRKVRFDDDKNRVKDFKEFKRNFEQGNQIPESLENWVVLKQNKLPEAIEVRYIPDYWADHPEFEKLLDGYTKNEWRKWAEKVKKVYTANLLYDQLYALRLLLKNEGDEYELLLGHGVLTWKNQKAGTVYAPIFLTPLTLDFDASKKTIEINPDPMFRNFVEISSVSEMENPAEIDLDNWMGAINTNPFDFWHLETLKSQASTFLNYLSPDSEDNFSDEITTAPNITNNPSIWNAPVIFVRKRTNSLWSKYAEKIRRDIEQNGARSTEFINDLIGEYEEQKEHLSDGEREAIETAIKEAELFFPLPWNDEQKRIAERLDANYGVVVKGPPGTGKGHTIANLIARFLAQGKSVLVTSQTSKALEVLRDKLPENIRSLVVSQLQQSAKRDDVLQQSISEISSNLGERHTKFSEDKAELIRKELSRVREEKASVASKIRQYILIDSTEKIQLNGKEVSPMEAAKIVSEHSSDESLGWFTDSVPFDAELNFTESDLSDAYQLLTDLSKDDRDLYNFELPDPSTLPNENVVIGAFSEFKDLSAKAKASNKTFGAAVADFNQDALSSLWESLNKAKRVLTSINQDYERVVFESCIASESERENWLAIIDKVSQRLGVISQARKNLIGHDITGDTSLSLNELQVVIEDIKNKVSGKTKLGTFGKMLLSSNAKKVLENYKVDEQAPDCPERINILHEKISAEKAEKEVKTILTQAFADIKNSPKLQEHLNVVETEVLVNGLRVIVNYHDDFRSIADSFKKIKQLSELSFTNPDDIESARELISSSVAKHELGKLEATFTEWATSIYDPLPVTARHPIREKMFDAIEKRSGAAWKKAIEELNVLIENKELSTRLNHIAEKISEHAPNLYQDIVSLADAKEKFDAPNNLELAWKIACLESWLDHVHNHTSISDLQNQHERLSKKEFQLNSDLVTTIAWQRQIDKVTKPQRDALVAWSQIKIPKTGKNVQRKLRHAQEALRTAKDAVPVWIMPIHRAAQMFSDPKAGMFDVVIVDEASQCDLRGLMIGYLGKKLLVVGDPDQISPAGLFQDLTKNYELISRYLHDFELSDRFSIENSLFHLAEWKIGSEIMLTEHFRSVPEIINFSNHYIYSKNGKKLLTPLRYPNPKGLLKPALIPVFVSGGYQNTNNKVNEPEAKEIVEKIAELVEDPNYQQRPDGHLCTFGVISLLAEDQAKYIKELLLKHPKIGEKVIEERNITCGDAYAFQGDERDVIFLSMVGALDPSKIDATVTASGYTDDKAKQRFNVAATRGRDQVFLYHSIPLEEFRNQNDWRYKLLNWYYNPKTEELEAGRKALKKEFDNGRASQFSYEVGNLIIDRGYQVIPEYPVIGYRIDLVVQGENARLAVECDGDQYHTLENWEADQIRERQLRRAGWEFWRVSGSSFYRHKDKALDSLWKKLEELGIKPLVDQ